MLSDLHKAQDELRELQGETPLIMPSVDEQAISSVVAMKKGRLFWMSSSRIRPMPSSTT